MLHRCEAQAQANRTSRVHQGEEVHRGEEIHRGEGRTQQKITLGFASAKDVGVEQQTSHF